ncbi:metal ABC transporter permease [Porphyromonadaceae bacterium W3.11]|nr:metal ABC transporter permease [Porphyromonadaceae bacterium W3.11]
MVDLFSYSFFVKSTLAVLLTGLITGVLGGYVVSRRMVFISGGITHSSFAGLGFGFFMSWSPLLCAMVSAILSGVGVEWLSQKAKVREDSAIAAVWSLGMALGILFTFLSPGYTPSLSSFLFGNILLVTNLELWLLAGYLTLTIIALVLWYYPLLYVSFDPEHAHIRGLPTSIIQYAIMIWICIGIVLSIRVMGIMMLMSMLTLPQMTIGLYTHRLDRLILWSSLLSVAAVFVALIISFYCNLPTGALSVLMLSIIFILVKSFTVVKNKYV